MSTNNPNAIEVPCPECKALVYDHVLEAMGGVCGECEVDEGVSVKSVQISDVLSAVHEALLQVGMDDGEMDNRERLILMEKVESCIERAKRAEEVCKSVLDSVREEKDFAQNIEESAKSHDYYNAWVACYGQQDANEMYLRVLENSKG